MKKQNEIYEKLKNFQDKDLIKIVSINSKDYLEETIIIAKEILQSRGINNLNDKLIKIKKDIIEEENQKNNASLTTKERMACFFWGILGLIGCNIFSLLITYVYIQRIKTDWRKKRKKEAWIWMAIGAGSMALLGSIIAIIIAILV